MIQEIPGLMNKGAPVTITFNHPNNDPPMHTEQLYCQLVYQARWGTTNHISSQSCAVAQHVLWNTPPHPAPSELSEYYYSKKRYQTLEAARNTIKQLPVLNRKIKHIKIAPYPQKNYDLLLLYLTPEKAMRLIQAKAYHRGERTHINTGGVASICADCTAQPCNTQDIALSLGCKGSRKHTRYHNTELIAAIPINQVKKIEEALKHLPETSE